MPSSLNINLHLGSRFGDLNLDEAPRFCLCAALPLSNNPATHHADHALFSALSNGTHGVPRRRRSPVCSLPFLVHVL